jgi:hypothetical protein
MAVASEAREDRPNKALQQTGPADYEFPDYLMGDGASTYGVRGSDDKTPFKPTPKEILKRHLEPIVLLPAETIEANLRAGRDDPWPEILESLASRGVKA